jgi:nicotinate-nucleotide adenylyltransferase
MEMARAALCEFGFDQILIMPACIPPHKHIPMMASETDRLSMVELACRDEPRIVPSALEIVRGGTTYTVDTLRELTSRGDASYTFVIGTDTVLQLETWRNPQEVFDLCDFVAFVRYGVDEAMVSGTIRELFAKYGARIALGLHRCMDVSSTQIRDRFKNGLSIRGLVPAAVEEYIRENGVYRE